MRRLLLLFYLTICRRLNTIERLLLFVFKRYKDRTFLVDPQTSEHISFGRLKDNADQLLGCLQEKGLKPQDVVAFSSSNYQSYFQVRTACHLGNYIFFALSPNLNSDEIFYFLKESKAQAFFYDDFPIDTFAGEIANPLRLGPSLSLALLESKNVCRYAPQGRNDIATYNLSSGTTQRVPKIVPLTNKNWVSSLYAYIANAESNSKKDVVFLSCIPLATAGSATYLPLLLMGATVIMYSGSAFSQEKVLHYIKRYRVNRLYLTPSWFLDFFEYCKKHNESLPALDSIMVGTEPIPSRRLKEAISFFGAKISVGYGMVEVLPPLTLLARRDYLKGNGLIEEKILGSVGKPLKGVEVKVVDAQRWALPAKGVGLVAIKSPTRGRGYLNNRTSKDYFDGDWFYSQDYGYFDDGGFLHILGRQADIVASAERDYFASEIEEPLYDVSFVRRAAAVVWGGSIYIFVCLRDCKDYNKAHELIKTFCSNNLPPVLQPREIFIKQDLPVSALGKLNKQALIEEVS